MPEGETDRTQPTPHRDGPGARRLTEWARRFRLGIVLIIAGVVVLFIVIGLQGGQTEAQSTRADEAEAKSSDLAQNLREDATTIAALCATGSDVARALDAAGQCGRAAQRLADPIVAAQEASLSADQIDSIVRRVLALTPQPAPVDQVVDQALARIAGDPTLRGIGEPEVRAIVAAAVASIPPPEDGEDGEDGEPGETGSPGQPGASFGGLEFVEQDGQCMAVVTFINADGTTRTDSRPVGSSACSDAEPPPPVTTEPPPPVTTTPPPPVTTTEPPPPVTTDAPPPPPEGEGDGGLLGG